MQPKTSTPSSVQCVCETCGTEFFVYPAHIRARNVRFCSTRCRDAGARLRRQPLGERIWPKVDKAGPVPDYRPELGACWIWLGHRRSDGYGGVNIDGTGRLAHRVVFALQFGDVPPDLTLDHLCRVRTCVNPSHLEVVTIAENVLRGLGPTALNARMTHCIRGHDDWRLTGSGRRLCRTCERLRRRQQASRRVEPVPCRR